MEWQQIIGFYNVAKLGSFTRAAEATYRTQSALSQQIKNLEKELECQLVERIGKRRLRLTSAGERFFNFSQSFLDSYSSLTEDLNALKGLQKGRLRVAAPFTTLYHLFPLKLKDFTQHFPHVELTVLDRSQQSVIKLARQGEIDFGLALESNVPADLTSLRWKKVNTVLMLPTGHPLSSVKRLTLRQIARHPLILPPKSLKHTYRRDLEDKFQKLGVKFHIIMESSNVELSAVYVEMGLGISFATTVKDVTISKPKKLHFMPLDQFFKADHIAVVMRKDKILTVHKRAFIDMLIGKPADPAEATT